MSVRRTRRGALCALLPSWCLVLACGALLMVACADGGASEDASPPTETADVAPSGGQEEEAAVDPAAENETDDTTSNSAVVDIAELDARFPTEQYNSEAGSVKAIVLDAITAGGPLPAEVADVMTPDFAGEDFTARELDDLGSPSGLSIESWRAAADELDGPAWIAAFDAWLAEFDEVESTEIHTWELQLLDAPDGQLALEVKEALWVVGREADGSRREDRMELVFEVVRPSDGPPADWLIRAVRAEEGRTVRSAGTAFTDVSSAWLPGGQDQAGSEIYTDGGPVLGDVDGDGDLDLFLPRLHEPALLLANDGRGRFTDVSTRWGLDGPELAEGTNSGLLIDVTGDGALDLIIGLKERGIRVLHNEDGAFRDVTGPWPLGGPGQWESLSAADFDGDGDLDVYGANYNLIDSEHQPESYVDARDGLPNILLRNEGGRFVDATADAGLDAGNSRWTYATAWADYDADGDMDLYIANDYGANQLFQNDGAGRFTDVAEELGATDYGNGMSVSWFDFDNDLDLDVYVSNMQSFAGNRITRLPVFPGTPEQKAQYRRFSQGNTLLANDDGTFRDATDEAGVRGAFWAWGSAPFDYDSDGDLDLFSAASFYTGASAADT